MNTEQLTNQLKDLERRLFIIEMDDYAYIHGYGLEIDQLRQDIAQIKRQLA